MEIDNRIVNPVVTIGSFDGIHLGHLAIIDALKSKAKEICGESVVVTFSPHPRIVLEHDAENLFFLTSFDEKISLLKSLGVDHIVVLPFTKELAAKTMDEFFVDYIKNTLHTKALIVGYNHRFGSDRSSDYDDLCAIGERENIEIVRIEKQGIDERNISSTTIRNLIKKGIISHANKYLTRPYFFMGDIDSTGQLLYFQQKKLYPPHGTYSVCVEFDDKKIETKAVISKSNSITLQNIDRDIKGATVHFL